jgi:hypothetical protein
MSIQVGDVVMIDGDLHYQSLYYVKELDDDIVTLMCISPGEHCFKIEAYELLKTNKTLEEARKDWSRVHGYSGV